MRLSSYLNKNKLHFARAHILLWELEAIEKWMRRRVATSNPSHRASFEYKKSHSCAMIIRIDLLQIYPDRMCQDYCMAQYEDNSKSTGEFETDYVPLTDDQIKKDLVILL